LYVSESMAPTQCSIEASAGSDTECHVAPEEVPQEVPPQGSGVNVYDPNADARNQVGMAQQGFMGQGGWVPSQEDQRPDIARMAQFQAMYLHHAHMMALQQQAMVSSQQPMSTQQQQMVSTHPSAVGMAGSEIMSQQYHVSVQQPLTVQMGDTRMTPAVQYQSPLNIHATPFQPSGPNSAATTACSSPANFNTHMAPENYPPMPAQQPYLAPTVPLLAVAQGTAPYSGPMYVNGATYPVQVPNMPPAFTYHAQPYQYVPNTQQYAASSSNGSSPAPDLLGSSYGSYTSAPADQSFRRVSLPYEHQASIPLAQGLDRLHLSNAPMYQPPKGHNMAQTSE
jgi:hypothetical protein